MLVGFESTVVGQRLRNLTDLRGLQAPKPAVAVHRGGAWRRVPGEALVPGDLISVGSRAGSGGGAAAAADAAAVPADCLLLAGSAVVEEAVLTGESAPQWKAPLYESAAAVAAEAAAGGGANDSTAAACADVDNVDLATPLDAPRHRAHVLFGGTTVLQHAADPGAHVKAPDGGCLAVVLRTGFESAQGRLMRTILASSGRVTAASWEAGAFICLLLVFAVAAAAHVLRHGLADPDRDRFKLYLNCVMIVTSVVPPELPMELTIAVNASLLALARRAIFCTEPFLIPVAGAVTTACFDKTGTLTSDEMVLEGVAVLGGEEGATLVPARDAPPAARLALGACHSLAPAGGGRLAGDPLERAAFAAVGWTLSEGRAAAPPDRGARLAATILRRHHFSAALRRMSVVLAVDEGKGGKPRLVVAAKGAPEAVGPLLARVPRGYAAAAAAYAARGGRVLALATRELPSDATLGSARSLPRAEAEAGLEFAGFAVLGCPLRPESRPAVSALAAAGHDVVMITGDAPLTACHVARELGITARRALVLGRAAGAPPPPAGGGAEPDSRFEWTPAEAGASDAPRPYARAGQAGDAAALAREFDLCVTGDGLAHATSAGDAPALVPIVAVFARTSPDQKEAVLAALRAAGAVALMCGDGTNDVGALKAAHVGVALLPPRPLADGHPPAAGGGRGGGRGVAARGGRGGRGSRGGATPPPPTQLAGAKMLADLRAAGKPVDARAERMAAWLDSLDAASAGGGEGADGGPPLVKPGDASAAAPFTAKAGGAAACVDVIRQVRTGGEEGRSGASARARARPPPFSSLLQGRAALVTTVQMFKILGLLSLTSAYALSVMYLAGVKLSDGQATATGALSAALFFMISQAKPLDALARARPHASVFTAYAMLSLAGQAAAHLSLLHWAHSVADAAMRDAPPDARAPDADFAPNLVNTTAYLVNCALMLSTFAANYVGAPFCTPLSEAKPLAKTLTYGSAAVAALMLGAVPGAERALSLVRERKVGRVAARSPSLPRAHRSLHHSSTRCASPCRLPPASCSPAWRTPPFARPGSAACARRCPPRRHACSRAGRRGPRTIEGGWWACSGSMVGV
jgi:cation-transporting ATPase 13A1